MSYRLGTSGGRLVAIEGPNGVGKSTITGLLGEALPDVVLTTEPTDTAFGRFLKSSESEFTGRSLALAIAADRCWHVNQVIAPTLARGVDVVTDRYVPSSLVLQRLDGLSVREIWRYNRHSLPAVVFYLQDDAEVIRRRLALRSGLSRLERVAGPERELRLYDQAFAFLEKKGWSQFRINCRGRSPSEILSDILMLLEGL